MYFDILEYKNLLKNNNDDENQRIFDVLNQFATFNFKMDTLIGFGPDLDINKLLFRSFFQIIFCYYMKLT